MRWCDIHFQWEFWLKDKLVATITGEATDKERALFYRQVIDVVLDPLLTFGEGIPHQS